VLELSVQWGESIFLICTCNSLGRSRGEVVAAVPRKRTRRGATIGGNRPCALPFKGNELAKAPRTIACAHKIIPPQLARIGQIRLNVAATPRACTICASSTAFARTSIGRALFSYQMR